MKGPTTSQTKSALQSEMRQRAAVKRQQGRSLAVPISAFYRHLAGNSKAEALRLAQLESMRSEHPLQGRIENRGIPIGKDHGAAEMEGSANPVLRAPFIRVGAWQ